MSVLCAGSLAKRYSAPLILKAWRIGLTIPELITKAAGCTLLRLAVRGCAGDIGAGPTDGEIVGAGKTGLIDDGLRQSPVLGCG
jgi:hypothetical protein